MGIPIINLRFTAEGPKDLAGNIWTTRLSPTFTSAGKFGGKAMHVIAGTYFTQGPGGYLTAPFAANKFRINGDFTISFWYKGDTSAWGGMLPFDGGTGAPGGGCLSVGAQTDSANQNYMSIQYNSFNSGQLPINNNIPDNNGNFYHIAFTRAGNQIYPFINGNYKSV